MRTVRDIIDHKPKPTNFIASSALVEEALRTLISVNLSYLIVMDGSDYKGIFSERDYSRNVFLKGFSSKTAKVSEVMNTDLPEVGFSDTVEYCMNLMAKHRVRYLLAKKDDQFRGIITIHDILREVIASKGEVFDHAVTNQLLDNEEGGRIY